MKTKSIPVGTKFGRLTVTGIGEPTREVSGSRQSTSVVFCECGNTKEIRNNSLKRGLSESCGCLCPIPEKTHGLHGTREYDVWKGMIQRTTNPRNKGYGNYGGRGVTVCKRWRDSCENLIADMGQKPTSKHSIDRIDNDGNYSCGKCEECVSRNWTANCRWATRKEQENNKRNNVRLTFYGKTMTLSEWANIASVHPRTIHCRLQNGWTEKLAVWTPVNTKYDGSENKKSSMK